MRLLGHLLLAVACATSSAWSSESEPIGYLRTDVHAPVALSPSATVDLTYHLTNICPVPVLLGIDSNSYQPLFIQVMTLVKGVDPRTVTDVWGPPTEDTLIPDLTKIAVSGVGLMGTANWLPRWPARDGIILLPDEGYARRITFHAGWIDEKALPKQAKDWLVINAAPPLRAAQPVKEPAAVVPGKPIRFGPMSAVMVPGVRAVPFARAARQVEAARPPLVPKEHDLQVAIEVDATVEAGKDLTVTYLIGNTGTRPVWVRPNDLVPAKVTWECVRGDKVLATIDGSGLAAMTALLPERPAVALNPGEYLTWRRTLLASQLPLKKGLPCAMRICLAAPYFTERPEGAVEARMVQLQGSAELQVR